MLYICKEEVQELTNLSSVVLSLYPAFEIDSQPYQVNYMSIIKTLIERGVHSPPLKYEIILVSTTLQAFRVT